MFRTSNAAYLGATLAAVVCVTGLAPAFASTLPSANVHVAAISTLGDLSPYRSIAADTLAIVDKGDIAAARLRIKDLETAWDKNEANLKPKDKATWTMLDKLIDAALTDLRIPSPKAADCAASLKALIAKMDAVQTVRAGHRRHAIV